MMGGNFCSSLAANDVRFTVIVDGKESAPPMKKTSRLVPL
jgi:hypothetical protein